MDPDKTLADIRLILADYFAAETVNAEDILFDLADLVDALDEWLSKGGLLPARWELNR